MSQASRMELMRRELQSDMQESGLEENFVKSIVLLAREMSWTIEHILCMPIGRFLSVSEVISEFYKEQNKAVEMEKHRTTFR